MTGELKNLVKRGVASLSLTPLKFFAHTLQRACCIKRNNFHLAKPLHDERYCMSDSTAADLLDVLPMFRASIDMPPSLALPFHSWLLRLGTGLCNSGIAADLSEAAGIAGHSPTLT